MMATWEGISAEIDFLPMPKGLVTASSHRNQAEGSADQILDRSPLKSNNMLQLLMEGLKTIFRIGK